MVGLPVGKQKFTYKGKILANSTTLAALNLDNGDVLHVSVKEKK
jgi:splicing factor 3A subunit 1